MDASGEHPLTLDSRGIAKFPGGYYIPYEIDEGENASGEQDRVQD